MIKCTHYGFSTEEFDVSRLKPVKNRAFFNEMKKRNLCIPSMCGVLGNKPEQNTGFWCSRTDAEYGWKEFCEESEISLCDLTKQFDFIIPDSARVYTIYNSDDVDELIEEYKFSSEIQAINFEKMAKDFDAIEVTTMYNGVYDSLYGWDCESILILNPEIIEKGEF